MNADPNSKKPRCDAKLKTLPAERQADIYERISKPGDQGGGFRNTLKWLADDGFKTSLGALQEFYSWYRLQQRLVTNARTVDHILEDLKRDDPKMTDEQLERAGQRFFSALAIDQEDSLTWKRIQDAKLKLGALELGRKKFQRDSVKLFIQWMQDEEAKKIALSNAPTADKTQRLGQRLFGDLWE